MSFVPPHPHNLLEDLRTILQQLQQLATVDERAVDYRATAVDVEAAIAKLEAITKKTP